MKLPRADLSLSDEVAPPQFDLADLRMKLLFIVVNVLTKLDEVVQIE